MNKLVNFGLALLVMAASCAHGKEVKEVFHKGNWSVVSGVDAMTDRQRCFASYRGISNVYATADNFFVDMNRRGGVDAYQVRVDDKPAGGVMPAMGIEKSTDKARLAYYFDDIYQGKRLRIRVFTVLNEAVDMDFDLTGFREAVDFMREQKCSKS